MYLASPYTSRLNSRSRRLFYLASFKPKKLCPPLEHPKALQYIMGHANIVMTLNYYAHATFHSAQEEMERLQAKAKTTTDAKPEPAAESAEETKAA